MRASELLDAPVHDADGTALGFVIDLRCVQDGPLRGSMQAPRISALIVSRSHLGSLLGYERREQGPWMVRVLVRAIHRSAFLVPWGDVDYTDGRFTLHQETERRPLIN